MSNKSFEQTLEQQINALPNELQPDKDLWQGIDIALTHHQQNDVEEVKLAQSNGVVQLSDWRSPKTLALAASFMLVAALSWNLASNKPVPQQASGLVVKMAQQHADQKEALLASFARSPELTDNWQGQLQELEDAAAAIEKALLEAPEDVGLLKMLQNIHQQQLVLIEKVHAPKWQAI